jgi:exodeoxyribonuclease VII large subunit
MDAENDTGTTQKGNLAELTVTELSLALKRTVEDRFGLVRVRGEITGFKGAHSSGHCYFALKDDRSRLEAVVWKTSFARIRAKMAEGLEVIVTGKLTTFPGTSKYQIVVESVEPAGVGALMALIEERKRKLAAEGLFAQERKQLLPYMPMVIGVVTSPTGAVIRDVLHRITDRFPLHVVVWPVRVQGETCGAEVANAIRGFNAIGPGGKIKRPDIIIVARGGGSIEDLWGFNDEAVLRAAADSHIPLISAVGHETDWTLLDLVADKRAPTPTGAAEMAVPVKAELDAFVTALCARLRSGMSRNLNQARSELMAARRGLGTPESILSDPRQRFDAAAARLGRALELAINRKRRGFSAIAGRLSRRQLEDRLAYTRRNLLQCERRLIGGLNASNKRKREDFSRISARLSHKPLARIALHARQRLDGTWRLISSLSHESVLQRGFALVRDASGKAVTSAAQIAAGDAFKVEMHDGTIDAVAGGPTPGARPQSAPRPAKKSPPPGQGDLF